MNDLHSITRTWRLALAALLLAFVGQATAGDVQAERTKLREQSTQVLARLYQASPSARKAVEGAAGYATFSNFGLKIGVAGTGKGQGLAVYKREHKETFMRFVEVQAGLGVGVKKYDLVFVFDTEQAAKDFVNKGWQYGGQATAALKSGEKGKAYEGAISISPGIWLYQLTGTGLAAELTFKSSKYYPDKELNAPDSAAGAGQKP